MLCHTCALPTTYQVPSIPTILLGEMQGCGCRHEKLGLVGRGGLILCAVGLNSVGSGYYTSMMHCGLILA